MKLALVGDLHLAEKSPRYRHTLDVLNWIVTDARAAGADTIILLGDVFEGQPGGQEYAALMSRVFLKGLRVGVLRGNHDDYDALAPFDVMAWQDVMTSWDGFGLMRFGSVDVLLIPYPQRGRPPFHDLRTDGTIQGSIRAATDRIAQVVRSYASTERPLITLGHFTIEGMKTRDAEFELHQASEVVVPKSAFDGVALCAVGHIHMAQDVTHNIVGVGSPVRHSFAEAGDEKSYLLVSIDGARVTWERRPTPSRAMLETTIQWDGAVLEGVVQRPLIFLSDDDVRGKEVKVVVEIDEAKLATYDPSVFDWIRSAASHFVLERRTITAQRVRAPEIGNDDDLWRQMVTWFEAIGDAPWDEAHERRLREKVDSLT